MDTTRIVDLVFLMGAFWVCMVYTSVHIQTASYGALMISLGVVLTILTFALTSNPVVARVVLLAGEVLFWGGFAVLATFESKRERERLRSSSWKEILLGRVPEHLQTEKISENNRVLQGLFISLICVVIFYVADRQEELTTFLVIAVVYAVYLILRVFKVQA